MIDLACVSLPEGIDPDAVRWYRFGPAGEECGVSERVAPSFSGFVKVPRGYAPRDGEHVVRTLAGEMHGYSWITPVPWYRERVYRNTGAGWREVESSDNPSAPGVSRETATT